MISLSIDVKLWGYQHWEGDIMCEYDQGTVLKGYTMFEPGPTLMI